MWWGLGGISLLLIRPNSLIIPPLPRLPYLPPHIPLKHLRQPLKLARERVDEGHLPHGEPAHRVPEGHERVVDGAEPGLRVAVGEDELCVRVGGY